jgi:hypothetical protein
MPDWAQQLKRELEQRLKTLRHQEKSMDFPDSMALMLEPQINKLAQAVPSIPPPTASTEDPASLHVLLQIWVERGKEHIQRNYGAVPLTPQTTVDQLVPYVRQLSVVLRQFELMPSGVEITRWDMPRTEQLLANFPATIVPLDLRPDRISVTGAQNEFSMQLDYEAIYGGGPYADLYIASQLYNQTVFFFWKVFKVPDDLKPAKGEKRVPVEWRRRYHLDPQHCRACPAP